MTLIPTIEDSLVNLATIETACQELGGFYVTYEGFNSELVDSLFREVSGFFKLSHDTKMLSKANFENYYMGFRPIGSEKSIMGGDYEQCEQYKLGFVKLPNG